MRERKSIRLHGYDYSQDNLYFVTSCVHNRICCFGDIVSLNTDLGPAVHDPCIQKNPKMKLNKYGKIAQDQWSWLHERYPYVILHEFVVMPNHIHGIIEINHSVIEQTGHPEISAIKIKSLSELMGAYKTTVSRQIHSSGYRGFTWQRSFYERIIRNKTSYGKISDYIINNPIKWNYDKFNSSRRLWNMNF
jgi:putative transposase